MTNADRCRRYRLKNPGKSASDSRMWRDANPGKTAEHNRAWRLANAVKEAARHARYRQEHRDYFLAYNANRRATSRAFIDAALAVGCVDCGTKEQAVLELDHVRGNKVADVSRLIGGSLVRLLAEIDKCEVRCANCHRRVTYERRRAASAGVSNAA